MLDDLNTPVVDYSVLNSLITSSGHEKGILTEFFLDEYHKFSAVLNNVISKRADKENLTELSSLICEIKDFLSRYGGIRVVEALSEYEKYLIIGDDVSCRRLQDTVFSEMDLFKETIVSSVS